MNHFEFFNLPLSLDLDEKVLKRLFYANSKKFHPDYFTLEGVAEQDKALELSTKNNNAYKTLANFDKRLHHLLVVSSTLKEEGQNSLPQEFLMEMMDINEAIMELQFDFEEKTFNDIMEQVKSFKAGLKNSIQTIIPKSGNEISEKDFAELKNYYLKSKYLTRLSENILKLKS